MAQHAREEREATDYLSSIDDARKRRKESFPMVQVMIILPDKKPYPVQIFPIQEELVKYVGGEFLEIVDTRPAYEGALCVVDEEAKRRNKPMNPIGSILAGRGIYDGLLGTVVVTGPKNMNNEFTSCPVDLRIRLLSIYA